jgi:hypothetical protein
VGQCSAVSLERHLHLAGLARCCEGRAVDSPHVLGVLKEAQDARFWQPASVREGSEAVSREGAEAQAWLVAAPSRYEPLTRDPAASAIPRLGQCSGMTPESRSRRLLLTR